MNIKGGYSLIKYLKNLNHTQQKGRCLMARKFDVSKSLEIIISDDGFPQLRIPCIIVSDDGEREHNFFLSPFRGYCFQVSGGPNGEGSYASTPVIGLGNVVKACRAYHKLPSSSSIYASNFRSLEEGVFDSLINACIDKFELGCDNSFMEFSNTMRILPEFTRVCISYISSVVEKTTPKEINC